MDNMNTKKWTRYWTTGGGVCSGTSMWVTLKGLLHTSGDIAFAAPLTVASGIIAFLLFAYLFQAIPHQTPEMRGKLVLGVALPGLTVVVATSTLMGILGMAAPEAQRRDLVETVERADARLEERLKQLERQSEASVLLDAKAAEFANLAEEEKKSGSIERKGGRSRAYRDLTAISEAFAASAQRLRDDQERREQAGQAATKALSELRQLAESLQANVESLRQASEPVASHLRVASVALAELERSALDGEVLGPVEATLGQLALIPVRGTGKTTKETQERTERMEAGAGLVAQLGIQAHAKARQALDLLRTEQDEKQERFTLLGPANAVIEHLWSVVHLVAFPVALDLGFPIVALIALSLMQVPRTPGPTNREPVMDDHSYEDLDSWTKLQRRIAALQQLQRHIAALQQQRAIGDGSGGPSHPS